MLILVISALLGIALALCLALTGVSLWGWAVFFGILLFLACQMFAGWFLGKRIKAKMDEMQGILLQGQKQVQEMVNSPRFRRMGSFKQAQIEVGRLQHQFIGKTLEKSKEFEPLYKWSVLLKKQINTFRMQLNYQDKNFREVDRLLPNCVFMDPISMSMRLARLYVNKAPAKEQELFFEKHVRRLRYGQGAALYGLYAWIALKRDDIDTALKTLLRADKKMENETIKRNIELLRNNKAKQFSLAGLGDEWYVLGLEEPRIPRQRAPQRPF